MCKTGLFISVINTSGRRMGTGSVELGRGAFYMGNVEMASLRRCRVRQWPPTFLAPRISFMEDGRGAGGRAQGSLTPLLWMWNDSEVEGIQEAEFRKALLVAQFLTGCGTMY